MREPVVPQFDAETYLVWESRQRERFELHHGFVVAFARGTLDHDRISLNLRNVLDRLFPLELTVPASPRYDRASRIEQSHVTTPPIAIPRT